ncbi:phage holin [Mesobacillus subterraneus]|uniref:Phage holin n=1 Tax=Mesobacillus subterraneus TaxID=285983 RepID=A0A3R9DRA4_9BACI|nr:phage holin [Mesobacillus subterraneus]RSD25477.1 phage holin [Mesobacillus subterraneus]
MEGMVKVINWGVRFKNKSWVIAFVSQLMIVLQIILEGMNLIGLTSFRLTDEIQNEILMLINAIFMILSLLGIIQDPTTKGYKDSERAMGYKEPN